MSNIDLKAFGPLAVLAGTWQGSMGDDTAPGDDRDVEKNAFREQIVFTPMSPTANHEQLLFVMSYTRTAWRLKGEDPFHQQLGYWLWDPTAMQVMHSFMIPRGVTVLAGGPADADSTILKVAATLGSPTFGILSNPFLDREFKTLQYQATLTLNGSQSFMYEEDTEIQIKGQRATFHHVDKNRLERTK